MMVRFSNGEYKLLKRFIALNQHPGKHNSGVLLSYAESLKYESFELAWRRRAVLEGASGAEKAREISSAHLNF